MKTGTVLIGNCSTYGRRLKTKQSSSAGRLLAKRCRWGNLRDITGVKTLKQYQTGPVEMDSVVELKKSQIKTTDWRENKGPEGWREVRAVMIKAYPEFGYSYRQFKGSRNLWAADRSGAFTKKTVFNYDWKK